MAGDTRDITPFNALIMKIERYCADDHFFLSNECAGVTDIYDITLLSKTQKMKCVLHPKLNYYIHYGYIVEKSSILVTNYVITESDDCSIRTLKEIAVLEYQNCDIDLITKNHCFFDGNFKRSKPLSTSREYYLPLYNNEDIYGNLWKTYSKQMKIYQNTAFEKLLKLDEISTRKKNLPVYGTVITKSKLAHFGKKSDSKNKYPFVFTIEVEGNNKTCSVSFWNKACLQYYNNIRVGQVIVLQNYRVKKPYGTRTNTVYTASDRLHIELSINADNPKGEVDLLDVTPVYIQYRFLTGSILENNIYTSDFIMDVVGVVTYLGRWEREKKKNLSSSIISTGDFWMYRWVFLNDGSTSTDMKFKLYACSQNNITEYLACGDIFVAARVLYKFDIIYHGEHFRRFFYLTSTRETQLYRFTKDWEFTDQKIYPFAKCESFLKVIKKSKDDLFLHSLEKKFKYDGYFKYPPIPTYLTFYKKSFDMDYVYTECNISDLYTAMDTMHVHQVARVNVVATVVAMELVKDKDLSNEDIPRDLPVILINQPIMEQTLLKPEKDRYTLKNENLKKFLGAENNPVEENQFVQLTIVDLNERDHLVVLLTPRYSEDFVEDYPEVLIDDQFLFVLDLFCHGNKQYEIVVNRLFLYNR